jgi:hypothetical protein
MSNGTSQKSAWDLLELWESNDKASVGEVLSLFQIYEMPPWGQICRVMSWQFYPVEGGHFGKKDFGYPGVYRLIALETEGDISKPATLNRVCGQDDSGTLYIGESMDLGRRLNQLRRSAGHRREGSHGAIGMLRQITGLNYPAAKLGVALLFTGAHTKSIERDLLWAYMNTFGDTPPLNYRL